MDSLLDEGVGPDHQIHVAGGDHVEQVPAAYPAAPSAGHLGAGAGEQRHHHRTS